MPRECRFYIIPELSAVDRNRVNPCRPATILHDGAFRAGSLKGQYVRGVRISKTDPNDTAMSIRQRHVYAETSSKMCQLQIVRGAAWLAFLRKTHAKNRSKQNQTHKMLTPIANSLNRGF